MLDTVETTETITQESEFRELSRLHDRCDRCGAEAFVLAVNEAGFELVFCGHHGKRYSLDLISQGFRIDDQIHRINEKPSPSASELD